MMMTIIVLAGLGILCHHRLRLLHRWLSPQQRHLLPKANLRFARGMIFLLKNLRDAIRMRQILQGISSSRTSLSSSPLPAGDGRLPMHGFVSP